jgi:hypothetical protein
MESPVIDVESLPPVPRPQKASMAVIELVAAHEGVDPVDLPPLYDVIDPSTLDTMFTPWRQDDYDPERTGEIRFTYSGHRIRVTAQGRVSIVAPSEEPE